MSVKPESEAKRQIDKKERAGIALQATLSCAVYTPKKSTQHLKMQKAGSRKFQEKTVDSYILVIAMIIT